MSGREEKREGKRRAGKKASVILEDLCITVGTMLVEIWAGMRNVLLETGGKNILPRVVKNLAELCSLVLWKVKLASHKTGYFTEEIPKQNVEEVIWFAYRKA